MILEIILLSLFEQERVMVADSAHYLQEFLFPSLFPVLSSLFSVLLFVLTGSYQLSHLFGVYLFGVIKFSLKIYSILVLFFFLTFEICALLCVCVCVLVCFFP